MCSCDMIECLFLFQAEDGIRDLVRSRGLGDVYKRQLPNGYQADLVIATLVRWVQTTPAEMCESLTWDRGSEMAHWEVLTSGWGPVSYTHLRAHETVLDLVCRLLLEKKKTPHGANLSARNRQYQLRVAPILQTSTRHSEYAENIH